MILLFIFTQFTSISLYLSIRKYDKGKNIIPEISRAIILFISTNIKGTINKPHKTEIRDIFPISFSGNN